jgi:predicted O-methyltransferase YrrM
MTNTLASPRLQAVLSQLFAAAAVQEADDTPAPPPPAGRPSWDAASAQERADAFADAYIPISAEAGKLLYALVRAARPQTVVEFGTSFGISTIYLAAAVTDNGTGQVLTTELSSAKVKAAQANLQQAGVDGPVTILAGDARETLADLPGPIGLVLLDGWKELCLPVLRLLEPKLAAGALVAADDTSFTSMAGYLDYVRDPAHGYVTVAFPVEDGMEISSWTGANIACGYP